MGEKLNQTNPMYVCMLMYDNDTESIIEDNLLVGYYNLRCSIDSSDLIRQSKSIVTQTTNTHGWCPC